MALETVFYWLGVLSLLRIILNDLPTLVQLIQKFWRGRDYKVDLKERYGDWAVVTGASDGIGKSYCAQLAARKINIVLIGRNREKLQAVATDLETRYAISTRISIADFSKGREIYENVRRDLKDVDVAILVNNVGIQYEYPMAFADLPDDEIWDNVNVNLTSATMMTRIVLPKLLAKNKGAIVNISSTAGRQPIPYMNLYAASKAYMTTFSEGLLVELKDTAITVQTIIPMYVDSKINHFAKSLRKQSLFLPDVDTYVSAALASLGQVDNTRAYWPHQLQGFVFDIVPTWIRARALAVTYKAYNKSYVKKLQRK